MSSEQNPRIGEVLPNETWRMLEADPGAVLIDVRTRAEWGYVGIPDLRMLGNLFLMVEWARLPDMSVDPGFVDKVVAQLSGQNPKTLLFLCRSGVRSLGAAKAVLARSEEVGPEVKCINVATGFEGDLDEERHRGNKNGWKVAGLPWRQS